MKIKLLVLFLSAVTNIVFSQNQWQVVNSNVTSNLNKIIFVTAEPQIGYIACDSGKVLKTTEGAYDVRINNLNGLVGLLATYPALAAVKTDANNFYNALLALRATQQTKEEDVRVSSSELDTERINVGVAMYANLGKLMAKYAATPESIAMYFDLALIQSPPKDKNTFSVVVAARDTANIVSCGFDDTTQFTLYTGNTRGKFFSSNAATGVDGEGVTLEPNTSMTVLATQLGEPGNTFLNVTNLDELNQGSYSVVML